MRKCAIRTKGSHGPSGLDVDFWSEISCNSTFGNPSYNLYHATVLLARMLCSEELVDPKSIKGLVACRLIPLDKSSGVRLIGVGKVLWDFQYCDASNAFNSINRTLLLHNVKNVFP